MSLKTGREFTFGSLFAGIGGLDLGLEMAGMTCKWQVEIDPFCLRMLGKHWPDVERFRDVKECGKRNLETVDLVCGGFPCQDVSVAGKRKGLKGERSGLWFEMLRIVREIEPRWVLVENVPGLLSVDSGGGFGTILGDLAESGYDAEWDCIPAAVLGAPHRRDRVFLVAYPSRFHWDVFPIASSEKEFEQAIRRIQSGGRVDASADWNGEEPDKIVHESRVGGMADGISKRMDALRMRHKSLGNAVVPQIAEQIGRWILGADEQWMW